MLKLISKVKGYLGIYDKRNYEEYKLAVFKHEQLLAKIYSIELALDRLRKETTGA